MKLDSYSNSQILSYLIPFCPFSKRCGDMKCSKLSQSKCMEMLARDYKFLLAFENSNCVDYITEKFFNALANSVVPIVMGARKVMNTTEFC